MRFKVRKKYNYKNIYFTIICLIIIITLLLLKTIGKKASNNVIEISTRIVNDIIIDNVNSNIKTEILSKYNINDLITINYNNNEISNIDYNLEKTYNLFVEIKKNIIESFKKDNINRYNYDYYFKDNYLIIEVPFYNYTGNVFLINISPKIKCQINLIKIISGSVSTKVSTYGINTLKIDLYINIDVISSILVPFNTKEIKNTSEVLIASKIINGKIPTYYGSNYKNNSEMFNLE